MKIVNFIKHKDPITCGFETTGKELATFDIEFQVGEMILVWQGWSVRQFKDYDPVLQSAHMDRRTTRSKGTCVLIKGVNPHSILGRIREIILKDHGIEIPVPKKRPSITETKNVPPPTPESPALAPANGPKTSSNRIKELGAAMKKNLAKLKEKGKK